MGYGWVVPSQTFSHCRTSLIERNYRLHIEIILQEPDHRLTRKMENVQTGSSDTVADCLLIKKDFRKK